MKLRFIPALMTAASLAGGTALVAAGAQAPTTAQASQTVGERVTVTGCLQRAQRNGSVGGTIVGTSASPNTADYEANSSAMVDAFLLTDAVPSPSGTAGAAAATTAGSATAPASGDAATGTAGRVQATTYGLDGPAAQFESHTGARVEVSGTVVPPARSGRSPETSATASGAKRVKVESIKVVAEKCTAP